VVTLEMLADFQALSFKNGEKLGYGTSRIFSLLLEQFSVYDDSRIFHEELLKMRKLLFSTQLFDDLAVYADKGYIN
ncbi:MAG: hypothetical protein R6V41_05670, partial [Desulfobacteraceae bacterium]